MRTAKPNTRTAAVSAPAIRAANLAVSAKPDSPASARRGADAASVSDSRDSQTELPVIA